MIFPIWSAATTCGIYFLAASCLAGIYTASNLTFGKIASTTDDLLSSYAGVNCASPGNASSGGTGCFHGRVATLATTDFQRGMGYYAIFGAIWNLQFFAAFDSTVVAGAVAGWYFTRPARALSKGKNHVKPQWTNYPLMSSVKRAARFHLGSLALGSFITAIIFILRIVFEYIDQKTKKLQQENRIVRYIMCAVRCCLWCFEKSIKYITQVCGAFGYLCAFGFIRD